MKRWPSKVLPFLLVSLISLTAFADDRHYPGTSWERLSSPEKSGWSRDKLEAARDYTASLPTAAVMIVVAGQVLDEWGDTATRFNVHSIRKSFLSALYGIAVRDGRIDLAATMERLGIDDNEPALSAVEKQATVADLLMSRSGIYHTANYQSREAKAKRPARHSHKPGTFWYYNNWDFNALGTIFERQTKTKLFAQFKARIANPIGMQSFRVEDGRYVNGPESIHAAYPFRMTTGDMARFGLLYLREGSWRGQQIVPREWINESLTSYSDAGPAGGYGYMWWIAKNGRHLPNVRLPDGSYTARGNGGHKILVVPPLDLVVVHRGKTDNRSDEVTTRQFGQLVRLILQAKLTGTTRGD